MSTITRVINPHHAETLRDSAIDPDWASDIGVFSVGTYRDLPDDVAKGFPVPPVPALLFPLNRLDGSVVWQARLDQPPEGVGKYQQWKGTGAVLTIAPGHDGRVGQVTTVMIVEGTKQTIATSRYVGEDTLVVGIQGCQNWVSNGAPIEELQQVLSQGVTRVEVAFDADVHTNRDVYDAAKKLHQTLTVTLGIEQVRIISLADAGAGRKMGLDDWLGGIKGGDEARMKALSRLRGQAKQTLGARPRAAATGVKSESGDIEFVSDMVTARTFTQAMKLDPESLDGKKIPAGAPTVLLEGAAARIARVEQWVDEEKTGKLPPAVLTLDVATRSADGTIHRSNQAIRTTSNGLADVNLWLDNVPGQLGALIKRPLRPSEEVANAIRHSSIDPPPELVSVLGRFGWFFDLDPTDDPESPVYSESGERVASSGWRWIAPNGAIGAEDVATHLQARPPSEDFAAIAPVNPFEVNAKQTAEDVRRFMELRNLFNNPAHWDIMVASLATAFLPGTPNAAIGVFGQRSSGKSTLVQAAISALCPAWGPNLKPMATFDASATAMDLLASGMQDIVLHVDDLKPEADPRSRTEMLKGLDALLRRAHGAGGRRRGMVDRSTDRIGTRATDSAAPLVIVTGEEIPTGGDFAESGLDRMLVVKAESGRMFKHRRGDSDGSGALTEFKEAALEGFMPRVLSAYLRAIAELLDAGCEKVADMPEAYRRMSRLKTQQVEDLVELVSADPAVKGSRASDRGKRIVGSLLVGMDTWLAFCEDIGAYSTEECERIRVENQKSLISVLVAHTDQVMGGNADPATSLLERVRQLVASGQVTTDESQSTIKPLVGVETVVQGQPAFAINPSVVATTLRIAGGPRQVSSELSAVAILGSNGEPTRPVRINGTPARMSVIPLDTWQAISDEDLHAGAAQKGF